MLRIKKYLGRITLLVFIFVVFHFSVNIFAYFDVTNLCYINIRGDILRGNEKIIKKAIGLLKREERESYEILCRYVNEIIEKNCPISSESGCYIRGSKSIYLPPSKDDKDSAIRKRAEILKKNANLSKRFWDSH